MDDLELRVAWQRHVADDLSEFEAVIARHREPHRRYHGVRHVRWVVHHVRQLGQDRVDLGPVVAAAFYHDAVYDPRAGDNEAASARLAHDCLAGIGWSAEPISRVVAMIEATAGHHDASGDLPTAVLLAADLAVLAADSAGYGAYSTGVRFEYSHVTDENWVVGRSAVLRSFIDRDHIFPPMLDLDDWEVRARANIATELDALDAQG